MAMIKIDNLTFSYPESEKPIFENINLQMDTHWKIGLIGRNGRGKTTLLKLLLQKEYGRGKIFSPVEFDYFPCPIQDPERTTREILFDVAPYTEEWKIIREFSILEIKEQVLDQPFNTLSGGEKTKVLLAVLFSQEGRFLLIDEPSNHLDFQGRKQVSKYLNSKKGFILVSHDRDLLDECVDHIISLNRNSIDVQQGNFSSWLKNFNDQQAFEERKNEHLKKDIARLQSSAKRTEVWSYKVEASKRGAPDKGFVGHKAAKMMKRSKSIESRQQKAIQEKKSLLKDEEVQESLKIHPLKYHSKTIITLFQVAACYGNGPIHDPVSFEIHQNDRVCIQGKNGSGKSSLLKLMLKEPIDHIGKVQVKEGLIVSVIPQETSFLKGTFHQFASMHQLDESLWKAILRKMDFDREIFDKNLQNLSEGQKKKVLLAASLSKPAHLYVWDEPFNFIDVYSRMQIETLLEEFEVTMVFVEHDDHFSKTFATKVIQL